MATVISIFAFVFSAEKNLVKILKSNVECHARILNPRIPRSVYGLFNIEMQEEKSQLLMSTFPLVNIKECQTISVKPYV